MLCFVFLAGILFFLNPFGLHAQDRETLDRTMYNYGLSGGPLVHTNGWGLNLRYEKKVIDKKYRIVEVDFLAKLKHPKEVKVVNPSYDNSNPYVFGKKNSLMVLCAGMGNKHILAEKEQVMGIKINVFYAGGISAGLLKPVYLEITEHSPDDPPTNVIKKYDPDKHTDQSFIKGGAPFYQGLNELSLVPGAFLKSGLSFDWSSKGNKIKQLETGFMVDGFPKNMPIFAFIENKKLFINLYITLTFGNRW